MDEKIIDYLISKLDPEKPSSWIVLGIVVGLIFWKNKSAKKKE